jgi:hypothetical protein
MSSTNRGYERHKHDYYVTPVNHVKLFLEEFQKAVPDVFKDKFIVDPCAGGDENHVMSYPTAFDELDIPYKKLLTVDIRKDSLAKIKRDYLKMRFKTKPDVIISNPPFHLCVEYILKALKDVAEGGYVIFLFRLNFYGSDTRKPLFDRLMPEYTFVHSKRMSFTDDKKTDSIEYAHFVYRKGYYPEYSKLKVIGWDE